MWNGIDPIPAKDEPVIAATRNDDASHPMTPGPFTTASLVADALSLGPHWIYNPSKIARLYPQGVVAFTDPQSDFHPNRKAGDFTHYGDQIWFLHESVRRRGGFYPNGWREDWFAVMEDYDGYRDGATKETLASQGRTPSSSNDLAGAARIGPLLDLDLSLADTVEAARRQTSLTHGDPSVADAAEFFVRAVFAIRDGSGFREAFARVANEGRYDALDPATHLESASAADPEDPTGAAKRMGLTCHVPEAFPLTLFFALRPGKGLLETLSDNALAGGDGSARGILLALLFTACGDRDHEELAGGLAVFRSAAFVSGSNTIRIEGENGALAGVLEMPDDAPELTPCSRTASPAGWTSFRKNGSPAISPTEGSRHCGSILPGSASRKASSRTPPS